jgi:hypothetical protein
MIDSIRIDGFLQTSPDARQLQCLRQVKVRQSGRPRHHRSIAVDNTLSIVVVKHLAVQLVAKCLFLNDGTQVGTESVFDTRSGDGEFTTVQLLATVQSHKLLDV